MFTEPVATPRRLFGATAPTAKVCAMAITITTTITITEGVITTDAPGG